MNRRAVIVSGGRLEPEVVFREIKIGGYIIGADGGVNFLRKYNIEPDYIVGDFDSIDESVIAHYKKEHKVSIREFNPVKDASDTEIAVRLALELGYKEITVLGATGTRMDHIFANIQVLSIAFESGARAEIVDVYNRIALIGKDTILTKSTSYGQYFSLFSLTKIRILDNLTFLC